MFLRLRLDVLISSEVSGTFSNLQKQKSCSETFHWWMRRCLQSFSFYGNELAKALTSVCYGWYRNANADFSLRAGESALISSPVCVELRLTPHQ